MMNYKITSTLGIAIIVIVFYLSSNQMNSKNISNPIYTIGTSKKCEDYMDNINNKISIMAESITSEPSNGKFNIKDINDSTKEVLLYKEECEHLVDINKLVNSIQFRVDKELIFYSMYNLANKDSEKNSVVKKYETLLHKLKMFNEGQKIKFGKIDISKENGFVYSAGFFYKKENKVLIAISDII